MTDRRLKRLLAGASLAVIVAGATGCAGVAVKEVASDETVFAFPGSYLFFATALQLVLASVFVIFFVAGSIFPIHALWCLFKRRTRPEYGWGILLFPVMVPIGAYSALYHAQGIHGRFCDKVVLGEEGVTSDVWIWLELHRQVVPFNEVQAITRERWRVIDQSASGGHWEYAAVVTGKSGRVTRMPINELLQRSWPEIANQAAAQGVVFSDDF